MTGPRQIHRAALAGATSGALVALALAVWLSTLNPWFLDAPWLYFLLVATPGSLAGALGGLLLRRWCRHVPLEAGLAGLLLTWSALFPLAAFWPRPGPLEGERLVVVGVDGATFDVIDAMGSELPNMQAVMAEGARGDLLSMEPMFSPLLWATISTGVPPEVHGIHGFHVQASDARAARFWEVMSHELGWTVGIYKWLVTYPPARMDGFMVPAWLAPGPETWPGDLSFVKEMELSRRLRRRSVEATRSAPALAWDAVQRGMRFSTLVSSVRFATLSRLGSLDPRDLYRDGQWLRVRVDRDVFLWALHRHEPQIATFTGYATDGLPHKFWRYHEPERFTGVPPDQVERYGDVVRASYRQADEVLGEIMGILGPEGSVVVLSDHGFKALDAEGAAEFITPLTERLRGLVQEAVGPVEVSRTGHKLVLTLLGDGSDEDQERLVAFLESLVQESTGEPFYRWEPVPQDHRSLGLTMRDERVDADRLASERVGGFSISDFVKAAEPDSGIHDVRGVFMARGPEIAPGVHLPTMGLLDVTPTLLALVGLPKAEDMPGQAPVELWREAPPELPPSPASYDHLTRTRAFVGGEQGVNEAQLRALGYIE